MKIAIVCGHFIPAMGYVEVYFAKELARMGHEVKVFTSSVVPSYVKAVVKESAEIGEEHVDGYQVLRLPHQFSVGQMIKSKGLTKAVSQYSPSLIIVIGLGKLFPEPVFKLSKQIPIITLLGDNAESQESMNKKPVVDQIKQALKKRVYKKAVKSCKQLFSYTPESLEIVQKIVGANLASLALEKNHNISLGFDHRKFFYDAKERQDLRSQLNILDSEMVMITATRVIAQKRLESVIDEVDMLNKSGSNLKYILIGFLEDDYGSSLRKYIAAKEFR